MKHDLIETLATIGYLEEKDLIGREEATDLRMRIVSQLAQLNGSNIVEGKKSDIESDERSETEYGESEQ